LRQQHVPLPAARGAGPVGVARQPPPRAHRRRGVPEDRRAAVPLDTARARVLLVLDHPAGGQFVNRLVEELPTLLPEWLTHQRWFRAKGGPVVSVAVASVTPLITEGDPLLDHVLLRVGFDSHDAGGEHYYQL